MQNITSVQELKNAIQLIEEEQAIKGQLLKEQVFTIYESLKPLNLIKNTLKNFSSPPYLVENITGSVLGIASGYVSKKIVVGASANIFRKVFGTILQFGITNFVAKKSDSIKSVGQYIVHKVFRRGHEDSESRDV